MMSVYNLLKKNKILVLVIILSIFIYALIYLTFKDLRNERFKYCVEDLRYVKMNRTKRKPSTRIKYVLLWTPISFLNFGNSQKVFIEKKCPHVDCYVTNNRKFFGGDQDRFDAIAFNGKSLNGKIKLPKKRYNHQKYIYINIESAINYPICKRVYDNYFNWTYTYKLNSDIFYPYFEVKNKNGAIVGPKTDMKWINTDIDNKTLNVLKIRWKQKSRTVAWIVSNCDALNGREKLVEKLKLSLHNANLTLATFGDCAQFSCPNESKSACWKVFERNFYFYLAFENSNCEDYVTEEVLNPLKHYVIPIVYGGANYSRFLPPGSYLDALKLSPDTLVAMMINITSSFAAYSQFFKWRSVYNYTDPVKNHVCALCSALHNRALMDNRKSYKKIRDWWLPQYKQKCIKKKKTINKIIPHVEVRNKSVAVVRPKPNLKWVLTAIDNKTLHAVKIRWKQKSRAVAWLVSNCSALNRSENLVRKLKTSLHKANLTLATYGKCGNLSCPKGNASECWKNFQRNFYFYLDFENSNCEDDVLNPLKHYVIPIVYRRGNYSRFLPPGSYLDASKLSPDALVAKMSNIISSFAAYSQYFKWRSVYNYTKPGLCPLFTRQHNRTTVQQDIDGKQELVQKNKTVFTSDTH